MTDRTLARMLMEQHDEISVATNMRLPSASPVSKCAHGCTLLGFSFDRGLSRQGCVLEALLEEGSSMQPLCRSQAPAHLTILVCLLAKNPERSLRHISARRRTSAFSCDAD